MKFLAISVVMVFTFTISCSDSDQGVVEPLGCSVEFDSLDPEDQCQRYLSMLCDAQFRHYGKYNEYAENPQELQEFLSLPAESVLCPVNGEYYFQVTDESYFIECPSNAGISHGFVLDGFVSWPPDPWEYENICHQNMLWVGSACSMYYGKYNTYPDSLSDLEEYINIQMIYCPLNGDYFYYGDTETYYIGCPAEHGMSHGFIDDGFPSWFD